MNRLSFRSNQLKFKTAKEMTDHFRDIYRIYPNLMKEIQRMSTCNRLDLQTLGSQPIMPKNLRDHCPTILSAIKFFSLFSKDYAHSHVDASRTGEGVTFNSFSKIFADLTSIDKNDL